MRPTAFILAALLLAAAIVPTASAAGPLPPNPFNSFACATGPGGGVIGFVETLVGLTCVYALGVGSATYNFACWLVQGGGC